ncbi:MAG TPA: PAS domain S-box protein, partial [Chloroflexi bacterium]|nr:PAS domain S-box protein [Chloroflexota bacterium]
LLSALAWQAAIALENARLFDDVRRQRDEISRMKHYMDNIFASIASGVITIDDQDVLTTFNRAAEKILGLSSQQAVNHPYQQALSFLRYTPLPTLIQDVRQHQQAYVAQEISLNLPKGNQRYLSISLSPLQSNHHDTQGVAIVMEDVTEKKVYEHERSMLRRYLPSGLVEQLPQDLTQLGLSENRQVITILFADIRGFTSFSEAKPPERVMDVLNNYLTLAEAAVRFNWGIVDKYMGDAILALFNTPLLEQEDHAWHALRMAWTLREAIQAYHQYIPPEEQLFMGYGICTGVVVIGNVGTEGRMEYTAVGDTVNVAKRLQEKAKPGQILISHETWERVRDRAQAQALPAMRVKGRRTYTRAYEITAIDDLGW